MTQPGVSIVPQPGWWVRTDTVGVASTTYGWSSTVTGVAPVAASGTVVSTLTKPPAAFNGVPTGTIAATQKQLAASLTGGQTFAATLAAALNPTTAALTGVMLPQGTISALLAKTTGFFSAGNTGTIASSLQKASASLSGVQLPTYISGGPAQQNEPATGPATATQTWTETIPSNAKLAIVWVSTDDSGTAGTHTVTVGGTSMTLTSNLAFTNVGGFFGNLYCFTMLAPPTGSQTFVVTRANCNALNCATAYYAAVSSLGTPITASPITSTSMSMSATSTSAGSLYAQAFTTLASTAGDAITSYGQTQRSPTGLATSSDGVYDPLVFGDAPGNGGTLTFTAHQPSGTASQGGGGIILPLS